MPDSTAMKMKLGMLKGMEKYQKGVKKVYKGAELASKAVVMMVGVDTFTKKEHDAMYNSKMAKGMRKALKIKDKR